MRIPSFKNKFVLVLSLVFLVAILSLFQKPLKGFFYFISSSPQSFLWQKGSGMANFFSSFFTTAHLKELTNQLQAENYSLKAQLANFQDIQKENDQLRQALSLGVKEKFTVMLVSVVAKDPNEDTVTINKGKHGGIVQGMPVITSSKVVVGKVSEVFDTASNVMLLSNEKSSVDAKVQGRDISGLLRGQGRSQALFDLVPKDKGLAQGDTLITTSLGGNFPNNLLIGSVANIHGNDIQPFESATVSPFFSLNLGEFLFVITKE